MKFLMQGRRVKRQLDDMHAELNHLQSCLREIGRATSLTTVRHMVRVALSTATSKGTALQER